MLKVIYRISDHGNPKEKLPVAQLDCLANCISVFGKDAMVLYADHCQPSTLQWIEKEGIKMIQTRLGNAESWRMAAHKCVEDEADETFIYFVEDDYLHKPQAARALEEGLQMADYVSLYDHPDKYGMSANPYLVQGGEVSRILLSAHHHWKTTNSSTMTFGVKVKTLRADWPVWEAHTAGKNPDDFGAFQKLLGIGSWENRLFGKQRTLISCLPGLATHTELAFLSPLVSWEL